MKKTLLIIFCFLATLLIQAQSYSLKQIVDKINVQEGISKSQKKEITKLAETYYPKADKIQMSKTSDDMKMFQALALKSEFDGDLSKILTKEQFKAYQEMCDEYQKKRLKQYNR